MAAWSCLSIWGWSSRRTKNFRSTDHIDGDIRLGYDGRGAWPIFEERHFPKEVARTASGDDFAVDEHLHCPFQHDDELIPAAALMGELASLGQLELCRQSRYLPKVLFGESGEQRDLGQQFVGRLLGHTVSFLQRVTQVCRIRVSRARWLSALPSSS